MAPVTNFRPYRDFLTTSLHRRFASASIYTLFLCYAIAIWMGDFNGVFWTWFPLSSVGLRTIALYIPAFMVFMIRVAQWHVGPRQTATSFQSFTRILAKQSTYMTIVLYMFSGCLYGEIYIWTQSQVGKLQFTVDHGRFTERIKMNERPIYLRFMFMTLALAQTAVHLWADYDRIRLPVKKSEETGKIDVPKHLLAKSGSTFTRCLMMTAATLPVGTLGYYVVGREPLWRLHYFLIQFFVSLSKNPKPSGLSPFISLVAIYLIEGTLLTLLWQCTNIIFSAYICREPLKKDLPITNDSKDPNGSLLNGLKSKKDTVKSIAFWELGIIAERFAERRKTLYMDKDRPKGPTHKQVTVICLTEIGDIVKRVNAAMNPNSPPSDAGKNLVPAETHLVRQISQPIKDGQILGPKVQPTTRWEKVGAVTSEIARTNSSPQNVQNSYAKEYIKKGQEKASQGVVQVEGWFDAYKNKLAAAPIGWSFRQSVARTANIVVNGAPYSRQSLIFNAVRTLANLAIHSLTEDQYGSFQKEIPEIVRTITASIKSIEAYMQSLQIHWTDFDTLKKPESERRKVREVEEVLAELRDGLEKIVRAFNEYLPGLGLSSEDIRSAKSLVSKGPEVAQKPRTHDPEAHHQEYLCYRSSALSDVSARLTRRIKSFSREQEFRVAFRGLDTAPALAGVGTLDL